MLQNLIIVLFISFFLPTTSFATQSSELIPRSILFGNPEKALPTISPDGKKIAYLAPNSEGVLNVWIAELDLSSPKLVTKAKGQGIRNYFWHYDSQHVLYVKDFDGNEDAHLYITDLKSDNDRDLTPYNDTKVSPIAYIPTRPDEMLIGMNLKNKALFDVYRLNLATGSIDFDTECVANGLGWMADKDLFVRGLVVAENDGGVSLHTRNSKNEPWARMLQVGIEDFNFSPISFSDDNTSIYVFTSLGTPTVSLQKLDLKTKKLECILQDASFDMQSSYHHPKTNELLAVAVEKETLEWISLDKTFENTLKELHKFPNSRVDILASDLDHNIFIVQVDQQGQVPKCYLYDRKQNAMKFLFTPRPKLSAYELVKTESISFTARDGMKLYGYLTLPLGSKKTNLPCVLMVHGGPWVRDCSRFSSPVQWLANRGYAVLQVNYRGSTGYGKQYFLAGKKEWGAKMHDDLIDAKNHFASLNVIDPKKIAIYGGSYGGYATLCGLAFTPEEFACGVDIVGPSNLVTLIETEPKYWTPFRAFQANFVGDIETEKAFLESRSPLFKAHQITKPLLIAQGANDPRVKKSESDQIVEKMRQNNKPVEYILFENEGHGFLRPENQYVFYEKAEKFLSLHLGGKAEQ